MNDFNFNQEKQARRELAKLVNAKAQIVEPIPHLQQMADAPVHTTLRAMGKQFREARDYGKREAIKATMQLIVKHRWIFNLPQDRMKVLLEEAAGLKAK